MLEQAEIKNAAATAGSIDMKIDFLKKYFIEISSDVRHLKEAEHHYVGDFVIVKVL
ncbi:MAG: hypothetical protein AB1728_13485 [Bacteroidota bacterium]